MAVTKEWSCLAHGDFDGAEQRCPHGCKGNGMVSRAFRTAPAIQSAGYRRMNNTFDTLAREQGVSNMSNRSTMQNGTGMRLADHDTHRRLNNATEMIVQHGKAIGGEDASNYFKPLSDFGQVGASAVGALRKEGVRTSVDSNGVSHSFGTGRTLVGDAAVPLSDPKPKLEAAPFDGTKLGVPSGDGAAA